MKLAEIARRQAYVEAMDPGPLVEGCDHEFRFAGRGKPVGNCDRPTLLVCIECRGALSTRCSAAARSICGPCSVTYRQRVGRVFYSGWTDNPLERMYFVTLTAPSEIGGHTMPSGDICPCTPVEGINLAEWHSTVGQRWSWFITALRRVLGEVQYCKATEVQVRGAVHFHALVRTEGNLTERLVRELAIGYGFGHSVDVKLLTGPKGAQRTAWYCAKYASKAADDRHEVDTLDRRTGEILRGMPRLRVWTASRGWGLTMLALRASQARWARSQHSELRTARVCSSRAIRRTACVFVSFSTMPPCTSTMAREMVRVCASQSMRSHLRAHSSPRRAPVVTARCRKRPNSG